MMMKLILKIILVAAPCVFGDSPFNVIRDFKWRNLGVCAYCSVEMECCGVIKYGVENGTVDSVYYVEDRLDCSTEKILKFNYTTREKKVDWCYRYCRFCYQDPELTDITFFASSSFKKDDYAMAYLVGLCWTVVFVLIVTAMQLASRRVKWIRRYTLLPVFETYLQIYLVVNIGLVLMLTLTDTSHVDNQSDRMCCTQKLAFRLIVVTFWAQFDGLLPLFLLLQRTFTKRSLCKTFTESVVISSVIPIMAFAALTIPFGVFDVSREYFTRSLAAMFAFLLSFGFFLCVWLIWRIYWTRRTKCSKRGCFRYDGSLRDFFRNEIQKKRHFWYYAMPYILFTFTNACMQASAPESTTYKTRLTLIVIWNFVRVPLVYTCLCFETMFWLQGAKNTESMSRQVIGEMQHFLHDRSNIMIDYYDLQFGKKIGEGATAEVYKGRYKDRDVAIKVYTPKTITVNLLNEFAEEIDLMRKLKHQSVAKILGLAVMPPNVVVVLPLYGGGSLKQYLIRNRVILDNRKNNKGVVEDNDDLSTKLDQKEAESACDLSWNTRLSIAIEFCDSVRYIHTLRPPLMHRDLKPENILMADDGSLKLSDFGESTTTQNAHLPHHRDKMSKKQRQHFMLRCLSGCMRYGVWVTMFITAIVVALPIVAGEVFENYSVTFVITGTLIVSVFVSCVFVYMVWFFITKISCDTNYCLKYFEMPDEEEGLLARTIRGSPLWMAPEILRGKYGKANYGTRADVYSMTIVLWQILTCQNLYEGIETFQIVEGVSSGTLRPKIPEHFDPDLAALLQSGWHQDPTKRLTASEMYDALVNLRDNVGEFC